MPPTPRWDDLYGSGDVTTLPWYIPDLDADFAAALDRHRLTEGRVLDLGTGPATQAIALAKRGFRVTATDIAESAIRRARAVAKKAGVTIDFRVDDVARSRLEPDLVDIVLDRGVFHVLPPEKRPAYVRTVHRVLRPKGWLFLKCFSIEEPGRWGPYRIAPEELRASFAKSFELESIRETTFQGTLTPSPHALFAAMRRR